MNNIETLSLFKEMSHEEVATMAWGVIPEEFNHLDVVDLADIPKDDDFEKPGLHKRVRAGLGALIGRSLVNVNVDIWSKTINARDGTYEIDRGFNERDFDRIIISHLQTSGSSWGSNRAAAARFTRTTHVTNEGSIGREVYYNPVDHFVGIVTDKDGVPKTIGRLLLRNYIPFTMLDNDFIEYNARMSTVKYLDELHPEVVRLYEGVSSRTDDIICESFLSSK